MSNHSSDPASPSSTDKTFAGVDPAKALEDLKAAAARKASDISQAAQAGVQQFKDMAQEKAAVVGEFAGKTWTAARDQAKETGSQAIDYTREHPFPVAGGAFVVGLLIGLLCDLSEYRR